MLLLFQFKQLWRAVTMHWDPFTVYAWFKNSDFILVAWVLVVRINCLTLVWFKARSHLWSKPQVKTAFPPRIRGSCTAHPPPPLTWPDPFLPLRLVKAGGRLRLRGIRTIFSTNGNEPAHSQPALHMMYFTWRCFYIMLTKMESLSLSLSPSLSIAVDHLL